MKFKFIYMFFFLGLSLTLFTSSKNGRAGATNWGNTGAPGDQMTTQGAPWVCQVCHNSSAIQISQSFDMVDSQGNPFENGEYIPGETYTITVTNNVVSGNASAHGFQILCLTGAEGVEGDEVSNWTAVSSNVHVATASNTDRTYAEHFEPSTSNEFEMTWVAPAEGTGDITFYYVGVGVNLNNETSGDGGSTNTMTLSEGTSTGLSSLTLEAEMTAFPNPVVDLLNLKATLAESGKYQLRMVDMLGKVLYNQFIYLNEGDNQTEIDMQHLAGGMYNVQLLKDGKIASMQVVKK